MNKFARYIVPAAVAMTPVFAFAQGLFDVVTDLDDLLNDIIGLLMVLATAVFVWGLISYLLAGPDEGKAATARGYMIWGVISLAVIIAMWGLARLLLETFDIGNTSIPENVGEQNL